MKNNMEQKFCRHCNCLQWMFIWIEGARKFFECPDCGRVISEPHKSAQTASLKARTR